MRQLSFFGMAAVAILPLAHAFLPPTSRVSTNTVRLHVPYGTFPELPLEASCALYIAICCLEYTDGFIRVGLE